MDISLIVNGRKHTLDVDPKDSLLFILREYLGLTGTKNGCSQGHCGACTVVLNREAVKSCIIRAKKLAKMDKVQIITIEGIADNYSLHPIQQAFIDANAVQCGFCTPGYIMELYALYMKNPSASEKEIKSVLEGHLCRCTGYRPILKAALLSKELLNQRD